MFCLIFKMARKSLKLFGFTLKELVILFLINMVLLYPITLGELYLSEEVVQRFLMYYGILGTFIISLFILLLMSKKYSKRVKQK